MISHKCRLYHRLFIISILYIEITIILLVDLFLILTIKEENLMNVNYLMFALIFIGMFLISFVIFRKIFYIPPQDGMELSPRAELNLKIPSSTQMISVDEGKFCSRCSIIFKGSVGEYDWHCWCPLCGKSDAISNIQNVIPTDFPDIEKIYIRKMGYKLNKELIENVKNKREEIKLMPSIVEESLVQKIMKKKYNNNQITLLEDVV